MTPRLLVLFLVVLISHGSATPAAAQARDLVRLLQQRLDMKEFQNPMRLKEALGLLQDKAAEKGYALPIMVNQAAFKEVSPDAVDIFETEVKYPPYPRTMSVATALNLALSQGSAEATFVVRNGFVEIVPAKHITPQVAFKQKLLAHFERKPLSEVIEELSDMSGISIQVDSRLTDTVKQPVSATFRNDVSLRDALVILTDMAGLKLVELPSAIYVTTASNAAVLQGELSKKPAKRASK